MSAEQYSQAWWRMVLTGCGVELLHATPWAHALASYLKPAVFSKGAAELPDFLGQMLHETKRLKRLEEDLHYSWPRLMAVWPSRFKDRATAERYAMQPEKLANYVYGGRLGNTADGDGWQYRGRGVPMITGKANYYAVQRITGIPIGDRPELLATPDTALRCGVAWWEKNVPDSVIGDVERVTEEVNGGQIGIDDRRKLTNNLRGLLAMKEI